MATYYQARVSADELAQSREDSEKEAKKQAARIAIWSENGDGDFPVVRIMNRSPDPVTSIIAGIIFEKVLSDGRRKETGMYVLPLPSLSPCSVISFTPTNLWYRINGEKGGRVYAFSRRSRWDVAIHAIGFADANGVDWVRTPLGLAAADSREGSTWARAFDADSVRILGLKQQPIRSTASGCDNGETLS
ncbi:hypothetical protein [Streptomyces griseoaurantiacus]|uniref:hypothetical protein n=1 Tax=Streptomyces griseoaurantiacus TaxID=68213 RepID=UPI00382A2479